MKYNHDDILDKDTISCSKCGRPVADNHTGLCWLCQGKPMTRSKKHLEVTLPNPKPLSTEVDFRALDQKDYTITKLNYEALYEEACRHPVAITLDGINYSFNTIKVRLCYLARQDNRELSLVHIDNQLLIIVKPKVATQERETL